ncbi:hypothetical protein [Helicobacter rodentium]|uniref:hypothetical protein n=1 Tax=Helicobacter rodentium TaxID=59617 RepID=UPI0023F1E698|nr:hypothetical protein [Helicobacter rodentium]
MSFTEWKPLHSLLHKIPLQSFKYARLWIATILPMQNLAMMEKYALKTNLHYGLLRPLFCAFLVMTQGGMT